MSGDKGLVFLCLLAIPVLMFSFQNCSPAYRSSSGPFSKLVYVPGIDNGVHAKVAEQIVLNGDCNFLMNSSIASTDQNGADFIFNSSTWSPIGIRNAGRVSINGSTTRISIDGADMVDINGSNAAICVKAKRISSLNGRFGKREVPTVLVGQQPSAEVGTINGTQDSDLILINLASTDIINGSMHDLYISGGSIQLVNGFGGNIYLSDGAKVQILNGSFKAIFVTGGAVINNPDPQVTKHNMSYQRRQPEV